MRWLLRTTTIRARRISRLDSTYAYRPGDVFLTKPYSSLGPLYTSSRILYCLHFAALWHIYCTSWSSKDTKLLSVLHSSYLHSANTQCEDVSNFKERKPKEHSFNANRTRPRHSHNFVMVDFPRYLCNMRGESPGMPMPQTEPYPHWQYFQDLRIQSWRYLSLAAYKKRLCSDKAIFLPLNRDGHLEFYDEHVELAKSTFRQWDILKSHLKVDTSIISNTFWFFSCASAQLMIASQSRVKFSCRTLQSIWSTDKLRHN